MALVLRELLPKSGYSSAGQITSLFLPDHCARPSPPRVRASGPRLAGRARPPRSLSHRALAPAHSRPPRPPRRRHDISVSRALSRRARSMPGRDSRRPESRTTRTMPAPPVGLRRMHTFDPAALSARWRGKRARSDGAPEPSAHVHTQPPHGIYAPTNPGGKHPSALRAQSPPHPTPHTTPSHTPRPPVRATSAPPHHRPRAASSACSSSLLPPRLTRPRACWRCARPWRRRGRVRRPRGR